jgi:uncharacterized protein YegP (UPF0339 family)
MRKLLGMLALAIGLGVLAATSFTPAEAQDKESKTKKVKDRKEGKEAAETGGTVEIYKDKGGAYRFRIKNAEGKSLAISTRGHDAKEDAIKDLDTVKAILTHSKPRDVKE